MKQKTKDDIKGYLGDLYRWWRYENYYKRYATLFWVIAIVMAAIILFQ